MTEVIKNWSVLGGGTLVFKSVAPSKWADESWPSAIPIPEFSDHSAVTLERVTNEVVCQHGGPGALFSSRSHSDSLELLF